MPFYIIDAWQGSEYWSGCEYTKILDMRRIHKILKKILHIDAGQDSEYSVGSKYGQVLNMLGLHKVLNKTHHYRYLIVS